MKPEKKARILSSDLLFARMLRAEIESMGMSCSVFINEEDATTTCDVFIKDLDTPFYLQQSFDGPILAFSFTPSAFEQQEGFSENNRILQRPFRLKTLQTLLWGIFSKEAMRERAAEQKTEQQSHGDFVCENPDASLRDSSQENKTSEFSKLSLKENIAFLHNRPVLLTPNEASVLRLLLKNAGKCVSRDEICSVLTSDRGNMCDVYVCHLRSKLEAGERKRLIFTIRGKGYMLLQE